jgi:uracil-DNA glycosylase
LRRVIRAAELTRKLSASLCHGRESLHYRRMHAQQAARAALAFWRAAGVDMDEAEAIFAAPGAPARAPTPAPAATRPYNKSSPSPSAAPLRRANGDDPVTQARRLAAAAQSVAELKAAVEAFEGCALKRTARNTVFADGIFDAPVLLIGEAPGKDEDEQGKPFVGRSGRMLDLMLAQIGLDRGSNILISNTIYWRPPGNRDPTQGEIVACLPFVERLIALMKPKLLILSGKAAAHTILRREDGVMKLRGRRFRHELGGDVVNAMVMLHPAYLLRQPHHKKLAWVDLLAAEAWLDELGVARRQVQ